MSEFSRPAEGFPFRFLGMKTNTRPDLLPPGKYPLAINIRAYTQNRVQGRPGFIQLFTTTTPALFAFTIAMRGYVGLGSNLTQLVTLDSAGSVFVGTPGIPGRNVGSLTAGGFGASMIPFRPNQSPLPWMYIANGADYRKFSAPNTNGAVTQWKAGIAEPQFAPHPAIQENFIDLTASPSYTQGGTAGAPSSSNRVSDTAGVVLQDPTGASMWTVQVSSTVSYQKLQQVIFNNTNQMMVVDVFAALPNALTIQSIYYFSGTTGRCVIVPAGVASEGGGSIFKDALLTTFRRGTMIVIGSEKCYVWSVTEGPNGGIAIETSTTGAHTIADTITTVPAISVITATPITQVATGTATVAADAGGPGPAWSAGLPSTVTVNPAQFTSDNLNLTGFGLSVPGGAVIQGIVFTVNWATLADTDVGDNNVFALKAGAQVGVNHSVLNEGVHPYPYGSSIDLWGSTWAPADVNAAGFGITLGAANFGTNIRSFQISSATVAVSYTTVGGGAPTPPVAAQTITDPDSTYQVTMGVGTMTSGTVPANPFNLSGASFQTEDYISLGIKVDTLANLTELKFLLDVGDGSFTGNFYYYTIRPSDIAAAVANTVTQLGTSQTAVQRAGIDAEVASISAQAGYIDTTSGTQLLPGSSQWTQIVFPLSALTRVGNDQTKSLQTLTKIQFLWNASGTINVATDLPFVFGGYQPDVGDIGAPFQYRVRPRGQNTGVVGNPSPASRYGVNPRRGQVTVYLPTATYDPQIDTWDVFRYGGATTEWRFVGSVPSTALTFIDDFDDAAAQAGAALDFDNFEPWPSVDVPNVGIATQVSGTVAVVNSSDTDITSYLPGTLVQLGGLNVYTLWSRPTLISGTNYLLQFVENAGAGVNVPYIIQEPFLANQHLPYMWGPDANGTIFACGDGFRPGTVSFAKNYAPDSVPDSFNQEITQPAEPLLGGEVVDGLAYVASPERWWAMYPTPDNPSQRYSVVQIPTPRGLGAPFAHCTDGIEIFYVAKDGIYGTQRGSITDADLYNLFPHDGVPGTNYVYAGTTIHAPNYVSATQFRLVYSNGYLYFLYIDLGFIARVLVCDLRTNSWSVDQSAYQFTAAYHVEQPVPSGLNDELNPSLVFSGILTPGPTQTNVIMAQQPNTNDVNSAIACVVAVPEFDGGDQRAVKQWGDYFVDATPAAGGAGGGISIQPTSLGASVGIAGQMAQAASRVRLPFTIGGIVVTDFLGAVFGWTDDYSTGQTIPTSLLLWHPTFEVQPASTVGWSTFGSSFALSGYMHIREVVIAYVSNAPITLQFTSYDGQSPAAIVLPSTGGAYQKTLFPLSANKGQLYRVSAISASLTATFQFFFEDSEIRVGGWGRTGPYMVVKDFGAEMTGGGRSPGVGPV